MRKDDHPSQDGRTTPADGTDAIIIEGHDAMDPEQLRERARLALRNAEFDLVDRVLNSDHASTSKLLENLRIYQAELEIQNEELRRSQHQAEEALTRFMALFTNLPIAELVVDQNGLVVEANPEARSLLGLRDSRSHQYFLARLLREEVRGSVIDAWNRLEENEATALFEARFQPPNGATLIADLHIARLPLDETRRPRFVCAIIDRTDAVRQREALSNAYDRLETSEERYRVLADFSPEWDYWLDADGHFIHVSPACLETTGYSAIEFINDPALLEQIIHRDDLLNWRQHLLEPIQNGRDHTPLQFRIRTRDGKERWIEHVCGPVTSEDGRDLGRRGVNRDVTARYEAQAAMRRSEALLNATGRMARIGGWEFDPRSKHLRWSLVTRELHEVDDDFEPNIDNALLFYFPEERERLRAAVERTLHDGDPYELELRLRTAKGREIWVKTNGNRVMDQDGRPRLLGSIQDVTGRVQASHALRASEARFRSVFDSAPLGIAVLDRDGRQVMANPALQRFLGYDAKELTALRFADYTHPDDLDDDVAIYRELIEGKRSRYTRDKRYLRKDGTVVWGRVTVALIRDDADQPLHTIGMILDLGEQLAAEHALRESERKYRTLFESASEGMWIIQDGRYVSVNAAALRMLGYADASLVLGKRPRDLSPSVQADGEETALKEQRIMAQSLKGGTQRFEWEHRRADGGLLPVEVTLMPVELGGEPALFVTWHDLTGQRAAEKREIQARTVFENTSEGIIITDQEQRILAVNRAFTEITGYSEQEVLGEKPTLLRSGRHDESFYQAMWATLGTTGQWRGEFWNRRSNGDIYPQLSTISEVRDQAGRLTNYVAVFGDITQLKRSEEELYRLAHRDALTGLPNRTLLRARLEQSLSRASRDGAMLALLFLDLDLFKNVNDTLGHPVGDALLQSVAAAMATKIRAADSIARLGGDEFVVLMEDIDEPNMAAQLARRLLEVFAEPFDAGGRELYITASIGISIFPMDGEDMDALLSNADVAMYQAKEHGRNTYRFFEPSMTEGAIERLRLENALRGALARDELTLVFQPQVKLANGCMYGAEVLLRWHHEELGEVSPARFIPVAEELGLIAQLGAWVLEQSCAQLAAWDQQGFLMPRLAVNLSVQQLERADLLDSIESVLARTGIEGDRLELEVTESMLMRHAEQVISNLRALRELGITIAVDDFGSGFSSLGYLKTLPINRLKIDKSFVSHLTQDPNDDAIARAVIALGHGLGLDVLAEGVETEAQAAFLRHEHCSEAQGFLFGRPMTAAQLMHFDGGQ